MSLSDKINEQLKQQKRPFLIRLFYSSKLSLILGIVAFIAIVYYKVNFVPATKKDKIAQLKKKSKAETPPLLVQHKILGKIRNRTFSRSFFNTGDILIAGKKGEREWRIVFKDKKAVTVFHPKGDNQPLMAWIKKKGSHFALYRVIFKSAQLKEKFITQAKALKTKKDSPLQAIYNVYKGLEVSDLPTLDLKAKDGKNLWMKQIVEKSQYNDLK